MLIKKIKPPPPQKNGVPKPTWIQTAPNNNIAGDVILTRSCLEALFLSHRRSSDSGFHPGPDISVPFPPPPPPRTASEAHTPRGIPNPPPHSQPPSTPLQQGISNCMPQFSSLSRRVTTSSPGFTVTPKVSMAADQSLLARHPCPQGVLQEAKGSEIATVFVTVAEGPMNMFTGTQSEIKA